MAESKYLPTREEIYSRGEALRWMQLMEWPDYLIDSIMMNDMPDLQVVRNLVYRKGPQEAKRQLILMIWEDL